MERANEDLREKGWWGDGQGDGERVKDGKRTRARTSATPTWASGSGLGCWVVGLWGLGESVVFQGLGFWGFGVWVEDLTISQEHQVEDSGFGNELRIYIALLLPPMQGLLRRLACSVAGSEFRV